MEIVRTLFDRLPPGYQAGPRLFLGSSFEVDVSVAEDDDRPADAPDGGTGGTATLPALEPPFTAIADRLNFDDYEVRIYDDERERTLVATIEIVSPSNKDRPDSRAAFATKVAALLANGVCVSIVDVVGTMNFNLYADLLAYVRRDDPALGASPPPIYAATLRTRGVAPRKMMDLWYHPLAFGQTLPTLPLWLHESLAVSLDLEASYEDACRALHIR